ncbi:MAG: LytR family transcriptional regulator, partial [Clostridia bacterium]|nr:LytR family transcriptional regulator [Clostridia bacterium]
VAQVMELPQGENPTVATVSNSNKLKEQDFFKSAENGDKILIYAGYKMAILYRPGVNKIIKVAPLVLDQNNENQKPLDNSSDYQKDSPLTNQPDENAVSIKSLESSATDNLSQFDNLRIVINNGTKVVGLTKDIRTKLEEINGINVLAIGNTKKNNYTKTIVVDLTGNNNEAVNRIAELVGGEVLPLPKEESKPEGADILIIVGK